MKKFLKIAGGLLICVVVIVVAALFYVKLMLPDVGAAPDIKVEATPNQVEHGRYLANHVMVCMDCHSKRDWNHFAGPPVAGTEGMGGEVFGRHMGFPGQFVSSNITPSFLGEWSDGEIFRAITSGVSKDGRALFNIMPYHNFGTLDEEDIRAVIAYLRTLKPIDNTTAKSEADFPMNFIINTIPKKPQFAKRPSPENTVEYGKYMATAAGCFDCHTKQDKGKFVGEPFAGGFAFPFGDGTIVTSSNITPHPSGIGNWTEEQFVSRFRLYSDSSYTNPVVEPGAMQTVMPWTMYSRMTDTDLKALYHYLKTISPVDNKVAVWSSKS